MLPVWNAILCGELIPIGCPSRLEVSGGCGIHGLERELAVYVLKQRAQLREQGVGSREGEAQMVISCRCGTGRGEEGVQVMPRWLYENRSLRAACLEVVGGVEGCRDGDVVINEFKEFLLKELCFRRATEERADRRGSRRDPNSVPAASEKDANSGKGAGICQERDDNRSSAH